MSLQVKHEVLWNSANGPVNIRTMEDEHIWNCVSILQQKIDNLDMALAAVDSKFDEMVLRKRNDIEEWIETFLAELLRRDEEDDHIERR